MSSDVKTVRALSLWVFSPFPAPSIETQIYACMRACVCVCVFGVALVFFLIHAMASRTFCVRRGAELWGGWYIYVVFWGVGDEGWG